MIEQRSRNPAPAIAVLGVLSLLVVPGLAVEMCFVPTELHQWNVTVDCDSLNNTAHANAWLGYSEFGAPCSSSDRCPSLEYGWGISSSDTDPYQWTGQLPRPTADLYLWLTCTTFFGGWEWAQFAVEATGSEIVAYESRNGVQNLGTMTDLHLVAPAGCSDAEPLLVGKWTVQTGVAVAPGAWGRVKSLYR